MVSPSCVRIARMDNNVTYAALISVAIFQSLSACVGCAVCCCSRMLPADANVPAVVQLRMAVRPNLQLCMAIRVAKSKLALQH